MMDLSIVIPARNEQFLAKTVENILENMRGDKTEIIVVLDGDWANPPVPMHEKVSVIYIPEPAGHRVATNLGAKISDAKYIMKVDAHCAFDEGFDVKMIEAMDKEEDNVTMVPLMKNLHAFDWVCPKCDWRHYQGPSSKYGKCPHCGNKAEKEIIWKPRPSPNSISYCFDNTLHFQYFGDYKKRPESKENPNETMSLQGSCFMATRKKFFELDLCEESWGMWGQQGVELSTKTHLSGGKVMCNKDTWYAHLFRTQGGDFGFPYTLRGTSKVRGLSRDIIFNSKLKTQIYPLSWLLEKFWPVYGWSEDDLKEQKKREMKTKRSGIYQIKCSKDDKVYIGSAKDLSQRFGEHLRRLRRNDHENDHLQKAWNKYGENAFDFTILRFCTETKLLEHEQKYIDKYKNDVGLRNMFNSSPNASSGIGRKHTKKAKKKMSDKQSGKNNGFYGNKHTVESKKKISKSLSGRVPPNKGIPHTEETKEKISNALRGKEAWNKGLTKEEDERIQAYTEKLVGTNIWKNREHPKGMEGKRHSEKVKEKIAETMRDVVRKRKRDSNGRFVKGGDSSSSPSKSIVYYTDNQAPLKISRACQKQLKKANLPIFSASLKPMPHFGENIWIERPRGYLTMFKQQLAAIEAADTEIIFFAEHDVLYHPSHFDFVPPKKDVFYYNTNVWRVRENDGLAVRTADCRQASGLCAYRDLLLDHYRKRVKMVEEMEEKLDEKKFNRFIRRLGFEPGTHGRIKEFADLKSDRWESEHPNVDIRRGDAVTRSKWKPEDYRNKKFARGWQETKDVPGWGKFKDFF